MTENALLTPTDLAQLLMTKEQAATLTLSVQTAQQIILKDETIFPSLEHLSQLPYSDVEVLKNLWNLCHTRQGTLDWSLFLHLIDSNLAQLKQAVVTIKIAYQPLADQVADLLLIVREQISPLALLEITYQPDLIAGCILQFNGTQYDYSLETWWPHFLPTT